MAYRRRKDEKQCEWCWVANVENGNKFSVNSVLASTASALLVAIIVGGFVVSQQVAVLQEQVTQLGNRLARVETKLDTMMDRRPAVTSTAIGGL